MPPHGHVPAPRNTIETYSARPEREPPKNENGEIICQHPACEGKKETFRRPCEWNKHMDKHERPYKCNEPTCEQNPGFTYSGGLLRHMREVHKKGVGPTRRPLFCPHTNCIRSTGEGFTRRENLEEHLRRRHSFNGHYSPPSESKSQASNADDEDLPRKRVKTGEPESPNGESTVQRTQYTGTMQPLRSESQQADALAQIPLELAFFNSNGIDSDLAPEDANRQLNLARALIAQQQESIRQLQESVRQSQKRNSDLEQHLSELYSRQPERSLNAAITSLPSQVDLSAVQDPRLQNPIQSPVQIPKVNGSYPPIPQQYDPRGTPADESVSQAHSQAGDKGTPASKESSNEPSRRIEIAKDLLSERAIAPANSA